MASIFSKIIAREIPGHIIHENEHHIAILDINPNTAGHTLCIPKKEVNKIFDLSESEYLDLMSFSRKVAIALEKAVPCKRIGVSVIGLEVPHVHVHLIPLHNMDDIRFEKKVSLNSEDFKILIEKIQSYL
jgi:histidine triad (HIT) family protein